MTDTQFNSVTTAVQLKVPSLHTTNPSSAQNNFTSKTNNANNNNNNNNQNSMTNIKTPLIRNPNQNYQSINNANLMLQAESQYETNQNEKQLNVFLIINIYKFNIN